MVSFTVPKRGAKIYIPFIVPENWQVAVSIICSIVAFILMIIAMTTTSWEIWNIIFQLPRDNKKEPVWLNTTLHWGLRGVYMEMCETNSVKYTSMLSLLGMDPQTPEKSSTICNDSFFTFKSCATDSLWCYSAEDTTLTLILLVSSTVGLFISTLMALTKRLFQPIGYSLCAISCCMSILYYRITVLSFRPANLLAQWIVEGTVTRETGYSFFVLVSSSIILILGMFMASWGTWRVFKEARVAAFDAAVPTGESEAAAGGTGEGERTTNYTNV
eukprot:Tbor_TRINITY_DN3358_c0_g1::TRINITY_DN3358_c0_g1_i1::g.23416::m.23416